jgi:acetyl-CoA C-acetyltransferase
MSDVDPTRRSMRDRVAVVGMACTQFGELYDQGIKDLLIEAALGASSSAGVSVHDVEAFWLGTRQSGVGGDTLSVPLKLDMPPVTRVENRCATGSDALRNACFAVASGAYNIAMAIGAEKLKDSGMSGLLGYGIPSAGTEPEFTGPGLFSFLVPAYAERYGVDEEVIKDAMTHIAWKNHRNGARNPKAHFRNEISREVIAAAPPIAGRLGIYDCSGVSDGSAAAIVVPAEHAYRYTDKPLYVKGFGLAAGSHDGLKRTEDDLASFPEVVRSAQVAYREAGITAPAHQLALAEVHDCFTPTEMVLMEDLGFSERGKAWRDVLDGTFDLDGSLPVNTDGGLKSFGHPVGASGLRMLFECWLQLRHEAPDRRQIQTDRTLGLTQNLGGQPGGCVSFVGVYGTQLG